MADPAADLSTRYRNLIGWTWLSHGGLLVVGVPILLGLRALVGMIGPDLLAQLMPREQAQLRHVQSLMTAMAEPWPIMLVLGLVLTPMAIAFLRRRPWARPAIELATWIHVLVLFPALGWWLFTLPPALLQFDEAGQPVEAMRMASHVSHVVTVGVMEGLAIYLLVLIRKPAVRDDFAPGG